jgi:hypothetical protein
MTEENVALALEAALGGFCGSLNVIQLRDRVFSLRVASKAVGFYIIQKKIFLSEKFKCYFHLWSDDGPNWKREFDQWKHDNDQQRTLVSPSRRRVKMGMNALNLPAPKPALKHTAPINKNWFLLKKFIMKLKRVMLLSLLALLIYICIKLCLLQLFLLVPLCLSSKGRWQRKKLLPLSLQNILLIQEGGLNKMRRMMAHFIRW